MKRHCLLYFFCVLAVFGILSSEIQKTLFAQQHTSTENANVCFHWAFGALKAEGKDPIFTPITKDTTLRTGDQFKVFLELKKNCYVYLIYHSSQGSLDMLFPHNFQQFVPGNNIFKKNHIPQEGQWFVLDQNVGTETFYLLASARRLNKLESFFIHYESVQPTQKEELKQKILAEIKKLRWQYRNFKKHAERPVVTMGPCRGHKKVNKPERTDITDLAVEISAQDFYSRTFTIDHQ